MIFFGSDQDGGREAKMTTQKSLKLILANYLLQIDTFSIRTYFVEAEMAHLIVNKFFGSDHVYIRRAKAYVAFWALV